MTTTETKKTPARIALQIPSELNEFLTREALIHMQSKSCLIRGILRGYKQIREESSAGHEPRFIETDGKRIDSRTGLIIH